MVILSPACSILRRPAANALRNTFTALTTPSPISFRPQRAGQARRAIHHVPDLSQRFVDNGIKPLFSKEGFGVAWGEYQKMLVEGVNELVGGTTLEDQTVLDIAFQTSRRPEQAATFNFASQAHNNHFFFEALTDKLITPPEVFLQKVVYQSYNSLDVLRSEVVATALALFGSGTVWIVLDRSRRLRILATYNAGSPYAGAQGRTQDIDTNTFSSAYQARGGNWGEYAGYGNHVLDSTLSAARGRGGTQGPIPLLSVSMWPQVYMTDYGVSIQGRRDYLDKWWSCVDWTVVATRCPELDQSARRPKYM